MRNHPIIYLLLSFAIREARRLALLLPLFIVSAHAGSLPTVDYRMSNYNGEVVCTAIQLDGGVVPLKPPDDARWEMREELTLIWPKAQGSATFRLANAFEKPLLAALNAPDAAKFWETYAVSQLRDVTSYTVREFQPKFPPINHWQIGTITIDYVTGKINMSALLFLWKSQDGTCIAVTMKAENAVFDEQRDEIYQLIGSSLLIK